MSNSFYGLIEQSFPHDRNTLAIECPERTQGHIRWSFSDLSTAAARAARLFADLGLKKGDRVVVQTEKSPEALTLYLGCLRGGYSYVPVNTAYRGEETEHILRDAQPALYIGDPTRIPEIEKITASCAIPLLTLDPSGNGTFTEGVENVAAVVPPTPCTDSDPAAILYTSGTTGRPKGAMLTHGNLRSNGIALRESWRFSADDVLLHSLPIFHTHGLFVASHCALLSGARMIWLAKFEAREVVRQIPRATVFMGVPTHYVRLLEQTDFDAKRTAHMRLFTSGSAPLLRDTFEEFQARTGKTILERYGMTETGMNTSNPYVGERRGGTVGFPLPGVSVRIASEDDRILPSPEIGGVQVRGPNVFSGYWGMPEKTAEEFTADGWFRTGDVGRFDADGYLHLVGRSKDLIISGGYNVYPKEVESLIDEMPEVVESAVIGVPHRDFGEVAVALAIVHKGAQLDPETIVVRLRSKLANYKVPKRAFLLDSFPRNAMGKVQKNLLRDTFRSTFA